MRQPLIPGMPTPRDAFSDPPSAEAYQAPAWVVIVVHTFGLLGALLLGGYGVAFVIPPAQSFPDTFLGSFHTFAVDLVFGQEGLPDEHDPDWMTKAEPGDVVFLSRAHVAWGQWSHVAVVVVAPPDARWVEPGSLALLDASIFDGVYVGPIDPFADWPRVVVRRASDDPAVRARIAEAALEHRGRVFAFSARGGDTMSSCTKAAIDALEAAGLEPDVRGWAAPDLLWRSQVWVD